MTVRHHKFQRPSFLIMLATMLLYVIYSWLVGASRLRLG